MGQQFKMLKQIQQMQARMAKVQEELGAKTVTGTAGGGMVEVVANGHQKVLSVTVKPEVVNPADVEMLQDLVLAAVNDAMDRARELATKEMGALTAGMGLPPGAIAACCASWRSHWTCWRSSARLSTTVCTMSCTERCHRLTVSGRRSSRSRSWFAACGGSRSQR